MKPPAPMPDFVWSYDAPTAPRPQDAREAGLRLPRTPQQRRADETTRVAREMIDAATEQRHAATERLRTARLAKEAQEAADDAAARAAAPPPPPKRARKAKARP
jgi:hypothetical protein